LRQDITIDYDTTTRPRKCRTIKEDTTTKPKECRSKKCTLIFFKLSRPGQLTPGFFLSCRILTTFHLYSLYMYAYINAVMFLANNITMIVGLVGVHLDRYSTMNVNSSES